MKALESVTAQRQATVEDRWILSRLNRVIDTATGYLEDFQLGEAQREIHDFFWGEYCDWYIEISKSRLSQPESSPMPVLIYILEKSLRLLHPFMPFITEELWQNMKQRIPDWNTDIPALIVAPYPVADKSKFDPEAERIMDTVIEIIRAIRNTRTEYKVEIGKWIEARIYADELSEAIKAHSTTIESLAKARPISIQTRDQRQSSDDKSIVTVLKEADLVIPLAGMVDTETEMKRIQGEIAIANREIERLTQRLQDDAFISKAPAAVVDKERERLKGHQDRLVRLEQELKQLG
jgi:valyl-tRNA synthetase